MKYKKFETVCNILKDIQLVNRNEGMKTLLRMQFCFVEILVIYLRFTLNTIIFFYNFQQNFCNPLRA